MCFSVNKFNYKKYNSITHFYTEISPHMDLNIREVNELHSNNTIRQDDCVLCRSHSPLWKNEWSLPPLVSIMAFSGQLHQRYLTSLHHPYTLHSVVTFHFPACSTYGSLQRTASLLPLTYYSHHLPCIITPIFHAAYSSSTTPEMEVTSSYETEEPIYKYMQYCIKRETGIISKALWESQISCKVA